MEQLPSLHTKKTFTMPFWALLCIQSTSVWQMGFLYYATADFTPSSGMALPFAAESILLPVLLGYLLGALLAYLLPHRAALWGRVLIALALCCSIALFLPLPSHVRELIFYLSVLCCLTLVAMAATLSINLYSLSTAWRDGIAAALVPAPCVAILQSELLPIGFPVFNACAALTQLLALIGLSRLPNRVPIEFFKPATHRVPKGLLIWALFCYTIACFSLLFASTLAESLAFGTPLLYLSSLLYILPFLLLQKKRMLDPMRLYPMLLALLAIGFVLWFLPFSGMRYVSIALLGVSVLITSTAWCAPSLLFDRCPVRSLAPISVLIALAAVAVHAALTELLRSDITAMAALFACLALVMLVAYLFFEPILKHLRHESVKPNGSPLSERLSLTPREAEVAELLVSGYTNADIAAELVLSVHTVKDHVKNIYKKLGVHNRLELANRINQL